MVTTIFFNIRRNYESDTSASDDQNIQTDIVPITTSAEVWLESPQARILLPTLVNVMKANGCKYLTLGANRMLRVSMIVALGIPGVLLAELLALLMTSLRKKIGSAVLVSVTPAS